MELYPSPTSASSDAPRRATRLRVGGLQCVMWTVAASGAGRRGCDKAAVEAAQLLDGVFADPDQSAWSEGRAILVGALRALDDGGGDADGARAVLCRAVLRALEVGGRRSGGDGDTLGAALEGVRAAANAANAEGGRQFWHEFTVMCTAHT